MKTVRSFFPILLCAALLGSCFPISPQAQKPEAIYTSAAETIAATLTIGANLQALETQLPPATAEPIISSTPQPVEPSQTPAPTATIEIITATTAPTATPSHPTISSTVNTNCREGPSSAWEIIGALMVGQTSQVLGRLYTNNWYLILDPKDATSSCWVWSKTTVIAGDLSQIPIIPMPSTPTPDLPAFSISASVSPASYTGDCPVDITVGGAIRSDQATDVSFKWTTSFGYDFDMLEETFNKAGKKTFSDTMTITEDTDGFIRFRIYEPYEVKSDKVDLVVNCN
jgi:uncharacterized protein YraI